MREDDNRTYEKVLKDLKGNEQNEQIVSSAMLRLLEIGSSYRGTDIEKLIKIKEKALEIGYNYKRQKSGAGSVLLATEMLIDFLIYLKLYKKAVYWLDKCITAALDDNERFAKEFIKNHPNAKNKVLGALESNEKLEYDDFTMLQHDVKKLIEKKEILEHYIKIKK